jgi:hypothetical protein
MSYHKGLTKTERIIITVSAVILFFLLYGEIVERVTGKCATWWNFNQKDSEFMLKGE